MVIRILYGMDHCSKGDFRLRFMEMCLVCLVLFVCSMFFFRFLVGHVGKSVGEIVMYVVR